MNRALGYAMAVVVSLAPYVNETPAHAQEVVQIDTSGATQTRRTLEFSGTLSETYDTNLAAEAVGIESISPVQQGGFSTLATGGLLLSQRLGPVQLSTSAGSSGRQYRSSGTFTSSSHYASLGISAPLLRRTTFTVGETVTYSSTFYFLERLFAATGPLQNNPAAPHSLANDRTAPQGLDNTFTDSRAFIYSTTARIHHAVSRRGTLELSGNHRHTDLSARVSSLTDQLAFDYAALYRYRLSRTAAFVLGYAYAEGSHGYGTGGERPVTRDMQAGVDYERPLSLSRRTTVGVLVGSSLHRMPFDRSPSDPVELEPAGRRDRMQYRLLTDAVLRHRFGRTWAAALTYKRAVGLVEGLRAPLFSESVSVDLGGSFGRRVAFGLSGAATNGEALSDMTTQLLTYRGSMRLQFQAGRLWAISTEYLYYFYDVSGDAAVWVPGLAQSLERDSVRVGLSMRVPVIGR